MEAVTAAGRPLSADDVEQALETIAGNGWIVREAVDDLVAAGRLTREVRDDGTVLVRA